MTDWDDDETKVKLYVKASWATLTNNGNEPPTWNFHVPSICFCESGEAEGEEEEEEVPCTAWTPPPPKSQKCADSLSWPDRNNITLSSACGHARSLRGSVWPVIWLLRVCCIDCKQPQRSAH